MVILESAVSRSLHLAKETWTENKIKEIEQILSNSRKQWINELSSSKQDQGVSLSLYISIRAMKIMESLTSVAHYVIIYNIS